MTAPLFFLAAGALDGKAPGDAVTLDGSEGHHAATVMRLAEGEEVQLADGTGVLARGLVVAAERDRLVVELEETRRDEAPDPRIVLVQALAKGDRDELAVESATELGVDAVIPWQAHRSIVQWRGERGERARRRWEATALAAAKQSRRSVVPAVEPLADLRALAARITAADLVIVLHESAATPLGELELPDSGEVVLVVGPEGGITPEELAALHEAGGVPARLGRTVLRSSTAGPAAIAALSARTRW